MSDYYGYGNMVTLTANGKDYLVAKPRAYRAMRGVIVGYHYFSTRDGKSFGPIRIAAHDDKPKSVGGQLAAQAEVAYGVNHEQMIADYEAKEAAE